MKHIAKELYCYDAEWIPCTRTGALLVKLPDGATEDQIIEAMWKRAGATPEKPHPFLKLAISRIVSISAIHRHVKADGSVSLALRSYPKLANPTVPEAKILTPFLEEVAGCGGQIVGFNSTNADLPILVQRGIANDCHCPKFGKRPEKPWEGLDYHSRFSESHLDLATLLKVGGFGSSVMPSLDEIAAACGIPGKLDHAGDGVLDLWRAGRFAEITGYNETDACTTYLLWLRTAWFFGKITQEQRDAEIAEFNRLLRDLAPTRPHLARFRDEWTRRRVEPVVTPEKTRRLVALWSPSPAARPALVEFSVPESAFDPSTWCRIEPHLVPADGNRDLLCRLGHDENGNRVPGRDARGRPLLLRVDSLDAQGVVGAVERTPIPGVGEWCAPEAA
jgi:predicted PolB exonuclease-like 3'-5' exonuclease